MAIPKYHEFMKPVLVLLNSDNQYSRSEIYSAMSDEFNLTEAEKEVWLPSKKQLVYKNRIGWALTYLKKAGLIDSTKKAYYFITPMGKKVVSENPIAIDNKYLQKFDTFKAFIETSNEDESAKIIIDSPKDDSPQDLMDKSYSRILSALEDDILSEVVSQSPEFFEKLVVDLLLSMGYGGSQIQNGQVLGKSGDGGVDGVIKEDKLGFDKIYVQAKKWDINSTIGRPELQKFVGALSGQGALKGAFITTAKFSKEAWDYAKNQHMYKIALIDGKSLAKLMIENNIGVSIETIYEIKKVDSDYFSDDEI
ncbi:MAG TPA: restriction endonuclease [Tissierellales bacterium]|nr:restriction endonuclease [Tissierellales bacterium]